MWIKLKSIDSDCIESGMTTIPPRYQSTSFVLAKDIGKIKTHKVHSITFCTVHTSEFGAVECLDSADSIMEKVAAILSEPSNGRMRGTYVR